MDIEAEAKNKLSQLTKSEEFFAAERKLKAARNEMFDLLQKYCDEKNLNIRMQNEMFMSLTETAKRSLFNDAIHNYY